MTASDRARGRMVEAQLRTRDIRDPAVLAAFARVPRHEFIPPQERRHAYEDHPVPIECRQTISQPYIVALMTEALAPLAGLRVLEVGTGSGYQAAILAELGAEVWTVERHETLARRAREAFERLGYGRIRSRVGDGTLGWPEEAPFDRILLTAAGPRVPPSLLAQLADGGRLVAPVGGKEQRLVQVDRRGEAFETREGLAVVFVPLVGREGVEA